MPPRPTGFFYGWVMLGVAVAMAVATMPTQTVVVSVFNDAFRTAAGLDVEELARAYTFGTLLAALPLPWVGRMADRYGLRRVTGVVALACAGALLLLSQATTLVQLAGCFFLIRFLGQGSLGMLAGHTIAMWFERRLGFTHAVLAIVGFAGGGALLPGPTAWLIQRVGYQATLAALAGMVVLLVIPAVLLVFRDRPEDLGQHLDGDAHPTARHTPAPAEPGFTREQALRTPAYWIVVPITCLSGLVGTALLFHMQEMLRSAGLEGTELQTAAAVQPWAVCFGLGMLLVGPLVDRFEPRHLLPAGPLLQATACGICLLPAAGWVPPEQVVVTMGTGMGVFGLSAAVSTAVANPAVARYFGRAHHGAIRGTITLASVAATGVGPWLAGAAYVRAGHSFTPVLALFAVACLPFAVAALFLRAPLPPVAAGLAPGTSR